MEPFKLGEMEQKFADIIWDKEPVRSGELTEICNKAFGWKKSTMFTMLKRLCERGIFMNHNGTVTSLMSKQEFQAAQGEQFINDNFEGSLPAFLAAFHRRKKLNDKEIDEIKQLIYEYEEE